MSTRSIIYLGLLFVLSPPTYAQQAMELYIPIGASGGVSKTHTVIGTIAVTGAGSKTFTLTDALGTSTITIPEQTPIWLDRSKTGGKNEIGSAGDIKEGLTVEVKYQEATRGSELTAEWIKVEVP